MQQKTTWMRYLTLGLITSLLTMFSSCDNNMYRYVRLAEYHFINETNYAITYPIGYEEFNIKPISTTIFRQSVNSGGKGVQVSDYISPLSSDLPTYKLVIKFDNIKCLTDVKADDVHSIRDIKNFIAEKIGKNSYKFTYTFTEADYNRATTCP